MAGTAMGANRGAQPGTAGAGGARLSTALSLCVAAALLLALLAASGRAAASNIRAEVSGEVANGFARLIFTLAEESEAEVRLSNGILIVAFKRAIDVSVDHLATALPGYVGVARRDPDGSAVRLALSRKVAVNSMTAGEKLFVDLLPEGWTGLPPGLPQHVVDELARRAREAEKKVRHFERSGAQRRRHTIRVRPATLPTLTRYVLDLPGATAVTPEHDAHTLTLVFDAPLQFDLADAKAVESPAVTAIDAETGEATASLRFSLANDADVRTFREESSFVVDVIPPGARAAPQPAPAGEPVAPAPSPAPRAAGTSPAPAPSPEPPAPRREPAQAPPAPAGVPRPEENPPPAAAVDLREPVAALVRKQGETLRLIFPFRVATPAAIFRRGGAVWLVFDSPAAIDVSRLRDDASGAIRAVEVIGSETSHAVRIETEHSRFVTALADDKAWVVTLGEAAADAAAPLTLARAKSGAGHAVAFIPFEAAQHVRWLVDPVSGVGLLVVTAKAPARGFPKPREFVDFRVLASVQGVAIEPRADDLTVEIAPERVMIARPAGLTLTPGAASATGSGLFTYRPPMLDVQSWGFDRQADFASRHATLMQALAEAPEKARNAARVNLARFYLARDMFAEAKGWLDIALASEADDAENATTLALRGIANLLLGRTELALKDFIAPTLSNQHDTPLWRAIALSRLGRFAEARDGLRNAQAASMDLPIELQRLALHESARCALENGDLVETGRRLSELESIGIPYELRAPLSLLAGRLAESQQRPEDALAAYQAAAESADQIAAAQGRLRLITLRLALKKMTAEEAVAELEMLTAGWRGDATEAEAMQLLARLYAEEGRYRDAFQVMRAALSAHPGAAATRRMQDEAAATFARIFLDPGAAALSPIEALGLFYDFRSLTPPGRRGDEMIRRLAERLVAMDLLPQASELLQHQVEHRLQGAARARVASRLAVIYLMNRQPDRALSVLRATRMNQLPAALRAQRLLLEARALSDSMRHELALEIIEGMQGREVDRLRADIHWAARDWRAAAEQIEELYGYRWSGAAPLDAKERSDILRAAIGYALAEDTIGLSRLRAKYAGKMAESPDARMFEVVTAPLDVRPPEFADVARAASAHDTLDAFLRDLWARYPESGGAASVTPQAGRG